MESMDVILHRRSIRKYEQKAVPEDHLREIVRAGVHAASAGNNQPWKFIIVTETEKVNGTTDTLGWLAGKPAPTERPAAHVVVLIPKDSTWDAQADAAAAIQNMMLAAFDTGIGSCWFGSINRDRLAEILKIPEEWHIYSVVSLGFPAETPRLIESEETKVYREQSGQLIVPKRPLESVLSTDRF